MSRLRLDLTGQRFGRLNGRRARPSGSVHVVALSLRLWKGNRRPREPAQGREEFFVRMLETCTRSFAQPLTRACPRRFTLSRVQLVGSDDQAMHQSESCRLR
jgi:hypothetical protein